MKLVVLSILSVAAVSGFLSKASAQDKTTCSGSRDACASGITARGVDTSVCMKAYNNCMKTGVWDTGSRRMTGIVKR
jgi:hypothetical protein